MGTRIKQSDREHTIVPMHYNIPLRRAAKG